MPTNLGHGILATFLLMLNYMCDVCVDPDHLRELWLNRLDSNVPVRHIITEDVLRRKVWDRLRLAVQKGMRYM